MVNKHIKRCLVSLIIQFSSVTQSCPTFATPWTATCQGSLSFTISQNLLKFMSIPIRMAIIKQWKKQALVKMQRNWNPYTSPGECKMVQPL